MLAAAADGRIQKLLRVGGPAILFRASVYDGSPLRALVDQFVTQPLVDAVAQEAARGRLLLVATTDLDKQEPVIWDMGAIAAEGGEAARTLFRDVLVASASIPGVFPPVLIRVRDGAREYEEMHVDGSTTVPFFVAPNFAAKSRTRPRSSRRQDLHSRKRSVVRTADDHASRIPRGDFTRLLGQFDSWVAHPSCSPPSSHGVREWISSSRTSP